LIARPPRTDVMTLTQGGTESLVSLLPFPFFLLAYKEYPAKRSRLTTSDREGETQEGRPPAKKWLDSAYEAALVARDYACIRRIPYTLGIRLQSSKDGWLRPTRHDRDTQRTRTRITNTFRVISSSDENKTESHPAYGNETPS